MKPWLKRKKKLRTYGTLLAELRLEGYNYKNIFTNDLGKP